MFAFVSGNQSPGAAHHTPPRVPGATGEQIAHGACGAGIAGLAGDLAVGHDRSRGKLREDLTDAVREPMHCHRRHLMSARKGRTGEQV